MIRRCNKKRGFTLMELMIAATIVVVALSGLLATYFVCYNANESAKNRTRAISDTSAVLEEIRRRISGSGEASSYVSAINENWTQWAKNAGLTTVGDPNSETITVRFIKWFSHDEPKQIRVTNNWTERSRRQSLYFETVMTKVP